MNLQEPLLSALLPLAFEPRWHPVCSLAVAPDLPDTWWTEVQCALGLTTDGEGWAAVPDDVSSALASLYAQRFPRRYRQDVLGRSESALRAGDLRGGLELLHSVGEIAAASRHLEAWMNERIRAGEHRRVQELVESLPENWIDARNRAIYWGAVISDTDRARAADARLQVRQAYDAGEHDPRLIYALAYGLQLDGQYAQALRHLDEALEAGVSGRDRLVLLQLRVMVVGYLGRVEEQVTAAGELVREAALQHDGYFQALGHVTLGYAREDAGTLADAEEHYQHAIRLLRQAGQVPQLATLLNNYSQSLGAAGRPAEALQRLEEAQALPGLAPRHLGWLALSRALVHHQYGQHVDALTSARRAAELLREAHLPGDEHRALLVEAEQLTLVGDHDLAHQRLREARALGVDSPADQGQQEFAGGVLAWSEGQPGAAQGALEGVLDHLEPWDSARAHLYLIAARLAQGAEPGVRALDEALTGCGTDAPLLTDAAALGSALTWLRRQPGWEARLTAVFGAPALAGRVPLHLQLLGPLQVLGPTGPLRFPLRRSAELLVVLALHGAATRQQLIAALWEGEATPRVVDSYKKTLRGLRETLRPLLPEGIDPVPVEGGLHRLHGLFDVSTSWLPPSFFPAPALQQRGPIEVRGAFAADAQGPWADDVRAEIHERLHVALSAREQAGDLTVLHALGVCRGLL